MAQYLITGAYRQTGEAAEVVFLARNQEDAESQAFDMGILISETILMEPVTDKPKKNIQWLVGGAIATVIGLSILITFAAGVSKQSPEKDPRSIKSPIYSEPVTSNKSTVKNKKYADYLNHPLAEKFSPEIAWLTYEGKIRDWFDLSEEQKEQLCAAFSAHFGANDIKQSPEDIKKVLHTWVDYKDKNGKADENALNETMISRLALSLAFLKVLTRSPLDDISSALHTYAPYSLSLSISEYEKLILKLFTSEYEFNYKEVSTKDGYTRLRGVCRKLPFIELEVIIKDDLIYASQMCITTADKTIDFEKSFKIALDIFDEFTNTMISSGAVSGWITKEIKKATQKEIQAGLSVETHRYGYRIAFGLVFPDELQVRKYLLITREKPW